MGALPHTWLLFVEQEFFSILLYGTAFFAPEEKLQRWNGKPLAKVSLKVLFLKPNPQEAAGEALEESCLVHCRARNEG